MRRPKSDTTRTPENPCPACGRLVSAATSADPDSHICPRPGDVSICLYCGTRLVFTRTMRVRLQTDREWQKLDPAHRARIEAIQVRREGFSHLQPDFPHGFPTKHSA